MRKKLLVWGLLCMAIPVVSQSLNQQGPEISEITGVYQLPNGDFEGEWNYIIDGKKEGSEPMGWHSFMSNTGKWASTARASQLEASSEVRPGSVGMTSAKLFARKVILSIVAQGNLTTGRINAGSMTAADASGNYNFSDPDEKDFNQPFAGMPDSINVWVKYVPQDATLKSENRKARVSAVIHDASRYQEPEAIEYNNVVAKAQLTYEATEDKAWQLLSIPFVYEEGENLPAYILVTFTTNETPGKGTAGDYVLVDDIEIIYNSQLDSVAFDGNKMLEFDKDVYTYTGLKRTEQDEIPAFEAYADGVGAIVTTEIEDNMLTCTVKGNDYSASPSNMHIYTFEFEAPTYIEQTLACYAEMNVSNNILTVEVVGDALVSVYALSGLQIARKTVHNNVDIPLQSGVYLVKITQTSGSIVRKVVVY